MSKHILGTFDEALGSLRNDVLTMGSLAERAVALASKSLFSRDTDSCRSVIADDEAIDELEKQVDRDGIEIIVRFQPLASDLRSVISAMKISGNLERVGDLAVGIARRTRKLNENTAIPEIPMLGEAFRIAQEMFRDSLRSFGGEDEALARTLKDRDEPLDQLCKNFDRVLTEAMVRNPGQVREYLSLAIITRNIERIGDHATNIAEDAVYAMSGRDIRHSDSGVGK